MKVLTACCGSAAHVHMTTSRLIHESRWFEVTPMPGDTYAITVKDEPGVRALFPEGTEFVAHNQERA